MRARPKVRFHGILKNDAVCHFERVRSVTADAITEEPCVEFVCHRQDTVCQPALAYREHVELTIASAFAAHMKDVGDADTSSVVRHFPESVATLSCAHVRQR